LFRTCDFSEDFGGSLGPDVGLGLIVVFVEMVHDGLLQFIDALENTRRMRFLVISAKKRSTMLSQEPKWA
jgi:hypothetical protein